MYVHLLDYINTKIVIHNNSNRHVRLPKKQKLGTVSEVFFGNSFSTELEANTAEISPTKLFFRDPIEVIVIVSDYLLETQLLNNIRIYSNKDVVRKILRLVDEFPSI